MHSIGNWYGDYTLTDNSLGQFQVMSGDVYGDVDLAWDVSDYLSVTVGGNNIFDTAPDPALEFISCCGMILDPNSVMD